MALQFDKEKLDMPFQPSITGGDLFVEARFHFVHPSILSAKTEFEVSEHISRIGGFDSEIIDRDTLDIIANF